jgi:hypothetical protein
MALAFALAATGLSPREAMAEPSDPKQAALAQTLYDAAIPAMRAGDFAGACPKLEQVVELAPTGIGAKLMLAECYEGLGRLASAWTMYTAVEAAASTANQAERQKKARDRARALRPSLAVLTVVVPADVAATPGLGIRRDGVEVKQIEWGLKLPVDKGKHTLVATAPGRQRWEKTFDVPADGAQASVTVEALAPAPAGVGVGGVAGPLAPAPPETKAPPPDPMPPPTTWTPRRTAGMVVAAGGLALVGVGSVFGILAINKKNQSNDGHCLPDNHCDTMGLQLRDEGMNDAAASTALFVLGGAALVTGVTLAAIPPAAPAGEKASSLRIRVAAGPGRIGLTGTW